MLFTCLSKNHYRESQKKIDTLMAGYGIISVQLMFKIKVFICQSKANLTREIVFGKSTDLLVPEMRKITGRSSTIPRSVLVSDLLVITI